MKKINELNKSKEFLELALKKIINSMHNDNSIKNAKNHIKRAIKEIENTVSNQNKKKNDSQSIAEKWQSNLNNGFASLANQPMTKETVQKSINQLNSMIDKEQKIIEDINKELEEKSSQRILND